MFIMLALAALVASWFFLEAAMRLGKSKVGFAFLVLGKIEWHPHEE
ncbi:MAG: hypothetical protein OEV30_11810 [Ignavibacteria bacterium]|nr:hypothetical protein [Ignavibacteria bacterium]